VKFTKPRLNDTFTITSAPEWPSIKLETDQTGSHTWNWTIEWGKFKKSGKETTSGNTWDAKDVITNFGGKLTVHAEANKSSASTSVKIVSTNPTDVAVKQYLASKANSVGFDKIIQHESKFKHFNAKKEPIKTFDNGYGMCQLTTPTPTFEQIWNWKKNVDGGLALFDEKRLSAIAYLGQSQRSYTSEQLKYEAVCRWNGGKYHEWDAQKLKWVRKANILCDTETGNIGWDLDDPENAGKTEANLHKQDKASYSKAPDSNADWEYSGICYADNILK